MIQLSISEVCLCEELSVWVNREGKEKKGINGEDKYLRNDSLQESETRGRDGERLPETLRIPPAVGEITAPCKRADRMIE